jgi:hypothetical protein
VSCKQLPLAIGDGKRRELENFFSTGWNALTSRWKCRR